jgi:hypothetical protein
MSIGTFLWISLGGFLTLAIFSFLYKDNPLYKIAEHLFVGVSAGYWAVILWHNTMVPNLLQRLSDGDWYYLWLNSLRPWYIIPAILGALMFSRFSGKWSWVSRYPMAIYIGVSAGLAIPLEMTNRVLRQMVAAMDPIHWDNFLGHGYLDIAAGYSQIIILVGAIAALVYFFFSTPHRGAIGKVATFGVWTLMIGFGATFGFTVMNRISLFVNRVQFLWQRWMGPAFDSSAKTYSVWYQVIFWLVMLLFVLYGVREFLTREQSKNAS